MTEEEKTICKMYLEDLDKTHTCNEYKLLMNLLEQQPCDDCVSRAEILQMIEDIQNAGGFIGYNTYSEAFDQVDNMPPVTPTRKQGKWDKGYGFPDGAYWKCSCCNELIKVRYPMNYCPNCGAEMRVGE